VGYWIIVCIESKHILPVFKWWRWWWDDRLDNLS